jgi:hypothetical protein
MPNDAQNLPPWFETRSIAALLTMRFGLLSLILRSGPMGRVSKDGPGITACVR